MKKYTEQDLLNLIAEVEVEFKKHLDPTAEGEAIKKTETAVEAKSESKEPKELDYDAEDMAEMEGLYRSMSKAEAKAHFETLKKTIGVEEVMTKSEVSDEAKMMKSENETLKAENETIKKNLEKVTEVLNKAFGKGSQAPKQKAIVNMEVIKKSEEENKANEVDLSKVSKSEISSKLTAKIRSGKLEKKDKDAITNYYNNGSIELVKHLL